MFKVGILKNTVLEQIPVRERHRVGDQNLCSCRQHWFQKNSKLPVVDMAGTTIVVNWPTFCYKWISHIYSNSMYISRTFRWITGWYLKVFPEIIFSILKFPFLIHIEFFFHCLFMLTLIFYYHYWPQLKWNLRTGVCLFTFCVETK